jgi:ribonucleotide monophosphatase NagD (HAD superfamily)
MMFESALALRYPGRSDLSFTRLGKPHAAIFEEAFRRSGTMDMVMIGDTPETDIRGAKAFGIASALVETGTAAVDVSLLPKVDRPDCRMRSLALRS